MAGWSADFPISGTTGNNAWRLTVLDQIYAAWNDRRRAVGQAAVTLPSAGGAQWRDFMNTTSGVSFRDIQTWIQQEITNQRWAASHNADGSARSAGYFTGGTSIPWTLAAFRTAAGLNASGFTREPNDGSGITYGLMTAKDYLKAHLWNELYRALNCLVWTCEGCEFTTSGENNNKGQANGAASTSYATAVSNAQTAYTAYVANNSTGNNSQRRFRVSHFSGEYAGDIHAIYYYPEATLQPTFATCAAEFYGYVRAPQSSGVFNAQGTQDASGNAFTEDTYRLIDTVTNNSATKTATRRTTNPADHTTPTAPAAPAAESTVNYGWEIRPHPTVFSSSNYTLVKRWNVASGFTYY